LNGTEMKVLFCMIYDFDVGWCIGMHVMSMSWETWYLWGWKYHGIWV